MTTVPAGTDAQRAERDRPPSAAAAGPERHGLLGRLCTATTFNLVAAAANVLGGVVIARALGPTDRGAYAAIIAWFGLALIIGELGQTAATTFYVARDPKNAQDYVATCRLIMVVTGLVGLALGWLVAPWLAQGQGTAVVNGYRLMFAVCMVSFIQAGYVFGLQASRITWWNLVRLYQPVVFVALVLPLAVVDRLTLTGALVALTASMATQAVLAYLLARRAGLAGGRFRVRLVGPMARFGLSHLASAVPGVVAVRLDQLVLSIAVTPAVLGTYAIATSLTAMTQPVATALGAVVFPLLASRALSTHLATRLHRRTIAAGLVAAALLLIPLAVGAPWIIPAVFGDAYRPAVPLVALLVPAGLCLAGTAVCGDVLRGYGRPMAVARAQLAAAALNVALLAALVPVFGVAGAAGAASGAAALGLGLMLRQLRAVTSDREQRGGRAPQAQHRSGAVTPDVDESLTRRCSSPATNT
ncbi:lipopolysaccharide biosynthesis protein [Micromonospora eburnea]|uniref:Membrane protein involved in the export of O-antigen and teichoic acid n=1 Tax=Micromonospora eburnea TaxID=227316 RepID=A0A1C6U421_9ACTN|nr:oligosaccharide flippase family protein [Micromonospora eburnea]SCL48796.1 Membrane protein involved in the export of O-antigen and teichoic acid [Micromonospora eburnea]